jgi:hypothetical protein
MSEPADVAADWRGAGERIDALLAACGAGPGGAIARERAEELVRLVANLYGAGLERLLDLLHEHGQLTDEVVDALAGDELVANLLLVHGLHPYDVVTRIVRALPDNVELVHVTQDGVVRLRLAASGTGCGAPSGAALGQAARDAVEAVAPEVTVIEVEEAPAAPAVIPVSALFSRVGAGVGP